MASDPKSYTEADVNKLVGDEEALKAKMLDIFQSPKFGGDEARHEVDCLLADVQQAEKTEALSRFRENLQGDLGVGCRPESPEDIELWKGFVHEAAVSGILRKDFSERGSSNYYAHTAADVAATFADRMLTLYQNRVKFVATVRMEDPVTLNRITYKFQDLRARLVDRSQAPKLNVKKEPSR
jgi:hypothetical protein